MPRIKDVAERPAMQMTAEAPEGSIVAPELIETLMDLSKRCSILPDLDTREANEILGYDDIGAF